MKGISFTPEMLTAIVAGCKTQTRRIMTSGKPPFEIGDVLYIKEKTRFANWFDIGGAKKATVEYAGFVGIGIHDEALKILSKMDEEKINNRKRPHAWLPGRYMLASFARFYIRVKSVRIERVWQITEADAIAEGIHQFTDGLYKSYNPDHSTCFRAIDSFKGLWKSIHGQEAWGENPEVWVIEFEKCEKPAS